jgi:hypothetical protein
LFLPAAENLAAGMLKEVGIGLVGDAATDFMGWAGLPGRGAWWRIVPKTAVLEDLAYDAALMGLATPNGQELQT